MNIEVCRSFNLDTVIETVTTVTYSTAINTAITDNRFTIVQNNIEPSMILRFSSSDGTPIDFSPSVATPRFLLSSVFGFKTTLLNQLNTTTNRLTCTFDDRFDTSCILSIDTERMLISRVSHNKVLNQTYLTVVRDIGPAQHYRNSVIRVIKSSPSIGFLDAITGIVKIYWTERETSQIGIYELEVTFDRTTGGVRSKWTVSPITMEIIQDYSLSP